MLTKEELSGIIDALGALTLDEIELVVKELSFTKREEPSSPEYIGELCKESLAEHVLEIVSCEEVVGIEQNENLYCIPGPNAFPDIPFELSEVIDVLELSKREVDLSSVSKRFCANIKTKAVDLEEKVDSLQGLRISASEFSSLEAQYSKLLNLYYDYDFWLPEGIEVAEDDLQVLSKKLEHLRAAQDI
ncbi:hypothetical protein V7O66_00365 [Methanolobus sp. ZRKC3]|uniref:DUF7109 family protein n=1 Tax=Methanolobus sp. ZRKC3 TaxID=3125786 RepID=UPI00324736D1